MKKPKRKTIAKIGTHGRRVQVFRIGERVTVQCRQDGLTKSYRGPDAEARAVGFAQRLAKGRDTDAGVVTVAQLWERYQKSSDFTTLREKSVSLYVDHWALFVKIVPHQMSVEDVSATTLDTVRAAYEDTPRERTGRPLALTTIRKALSTVKTVFAWGHRNDLFKVNRTTAFRFKVAKEQRAVSPDEYTGEEYQQLLAVLSFDRMSERTACVLLTLVGHQGVRINAATHLRWEDVSWADGEVIWRARWDKQGNEWGQPLRAAPLAILARLWESVERPESGWIFPAKHQKNKSPVYTTQSFIVALHSAEKKAGILPRVGRAAHGLRRMVATDVAMSTGSGVKAMHAIGDKDERQANSYVKRRNPEVAESLRGLDRETA